MKPSKRKRLVVLTKKLKAAKELALQTEQQEQEKQLPNGLKELKTELKQEEEVKVEEKPKKLFGRWSKKDKVEEEVEVTVVETKEEDKVSE